MRSSEASLRRVAKASIGGIWPTCCTGIAALKRVSPAGVLLLPRWRSCYVSRLQSHTLARAYTISLAGYSLSTATTVTLKDRILALVAATPGLTDRELTDHLMGADVAQQAVNQAARALAASGRLKRHARHDGKLGNYPVGKLDADTNGTHVVRSNMNGDHAVSEDDVKRSLQAWLEAAGWHVIVKWGRAHPRSSAFPFSSQVLFCLALESSNEHAQCPSSQLPPSSLARARRTGGRVHEPAHQRRRGGKAGCADDRGLPGSGPPREPEGVRGRSWEGPGCPARGKRQAVG